MAMSEESPHTEAIFSTRLGPHQVPKIPCKRCGSEWHYDAANGEYVGQCYDCGAFLRRPTEAEHEKFTDFLVWNSEHLEREWRNND